MASGLRVLGCSSERHFINYHRVLSRACGCPRAGARVMWGRLVRAFVPEGPIVLGIDHTLERRRGARIAAKGIYHDAVRSSRSHFVKASGLRWLCAMLLAPIPFTQRVWALPVMTVLAPSERYHRERGRRHKRLIDLARQLLVQRARWLRGRALIRVADSSFASLELLAALAPRMACITRLRLDAQLFAPAPPRRPGQSGRPRKKGLRLPALKAVLTDPATHWHRLRIEHWYGGLARRLEIVSSTAVWYHAGAPILPIRWVLIRDPRGRFEPQALLCTDLQLAPRAILEYFVRRWQIEVTFEEARRHLGFETQRQWSDRAISRSTPVILTLFSLVALMAMRLARKGSLPQRQAAWYAKARPTFSDALAAVRAHLWRWHFKISARAGHVKKHQRRMLRRLEEAMCYAA